MNRILLLITLLMLGCQILLLAQVSDAGEPVSVTGADSLGQSASVMDSLFYAADSVAYYYSQDKIELSGNARVSYQDSEISADSMYIDLEREQAFTHGSTIMKDGEQILLGRDVSYDVDTQTGLLKEGISRIEKSYYGGVEVRKVGPKIYDVEEGTFTTCEHAEPDFWFSAKQLRIYQGDKIVGKPVVAWVNHFPVFYFPFLTMSIRRGRHPGFLVPEPGYNSVDGKFLRDIAWYYPIKDYADLILGLDLMERSGWKAKLSTLYTQRYEFDGNLSAAYQKQVLGGNTTFDWSLRARHHHELGEKAAFDMDLDFISNKRVWESSNSLDESLAERLSSSMSYRQPLLGSYLNVGALYTQDLVNDRATVSLPSASFSMPGQPVYELFLKPERSPNTWWSNLSYNYSVRLDHVGEINDPKPGIMDILWNNSIDPIDSTLIRTRHNAGIRHSLGLSYNFKLFGWLNTQQGLSYNEAWFDRDKNDDKWVRGNDYNASASANFNIYGIRNFRSGWLSSIRHIVTPSASVSFKPDFSSNERFYSFGGIGLAGGEASSNLSLNLEQKWQLKYRSGKEEKRLGDVLTMSSRASADLKSKERKFTNISHSLAFRPGSFNLGAFRIPGTSTFLKGISVNYGAQFSASHDPRDINFSSLGLRNQYFSHSFGLSGTAAYKTWFSKPKNQIFSPYEAADSLQTEAEDLASGGSDDGWKLSLSQDINAEKDIFDPRGSNLRLDASLKLSQNWLLSYSNYYDVKNSDLISQSISISRNLHCWKLEMSYSRRNEFWEYRIALFNVVLPDALRFQTRDSKRN
ncbi:MAG TPA: putative LPS assembly protein LptD [Candidatus Cloacimonadota bacterium]|nr:putative LPS assembly protein LptD [Candidatus Cloacimonadota bacterium]